MGFHVEMSFAHHVVVAPPPRRGGAWPVREVARHTIGQQYKDVTFPRFFQTFRLEDILFSVLHLECLIFMLFFITFHLTS